MSINGIDKLNNTDTEQTITVILTEKTTVNNKVDVRVFACNVAFWHISCNF